jgi:hypothetical protein
MLLCDELPIGNMLGLVCSFKKKLILAVFYVAYGNLLGFACSSLHTKRPKLAVFMLTIEL